MPELTMGRATTRPRVSVGLPVYNGENFLAQAIESILAQTFADFELIISDNASTDRTEEIARSYAAQDARIRYYRNAVNCGGSKNFKRVFELSRSEYFKWAAHDDICLPDFISECVRALDTDPSVVLSYSGTLQIGNSGEVLRRLDSRARFTSPTPSVRYAEALAEHHEVAPFYGLIRSEVLRKTPLLAGYPSADLPLLAELALRGRFHLIPEFLFCLGHRGTRSPKNPQDAAGWFDPKRSGRVFFPTWRLLWGFLVPTLRAPLPLRERIACWRLLLGWRRWALKADIALGVPRLVVWLIARLPFLAHFPQTVNRYGLKRWEKRSVRLAEILKSHVPPGSRILLADEMMLDYNLLSSWRIAWFPELDGKYIGLPVDDEQAMAALDQMRGSEGGFLVFPWSQFWWLGYYDGFHRTLGRRFRCILKNKLAVIYEIPGRAHASEERSELAANSERRT